MMAQGVSESWFSWPWSGPGWSVAEGSLEVLLEIVADEGPPLLAVGDEPLVGGDEEGKALDNVVEPGARDVVAKLGAAAAARAGSNCAAIDVSSLIR
jgi:hypothetical protein